VDGGRSLLGGKTSGSGIIESSLEGSLGSGNILDVIEVRGADLSSLNIVVDGVEGVGPQGSVLPSLSSCEGSVEGSLGSGHLGGVLKGGGGGQRQERAESLRCFAISTNSILVFLCPTSLYILSAVPWQNTTIGVDFLPSATRR